MKLTAQRSLLAGTPGKALVCFTCPSPTPSEECKTETNCTALSPAFQFCQTRIYSSNVGFPFTGNETVIRQCAELCTATNPNWLGITNPTFCCNINLCNRNGIKIGHGESEENGGAASARIGFVTWTLSASIVVAMLPTGL
ncbi:hypothetical protein FKM82_017971 [Ascaphus truei]